MDEPTQPPARHLGEEAPDPSPRALGQAALEPIDPVPHAVAGQPQEHEAGRVEGHAGDHRDEPADHSEREAHQGAGQEQDAKPERMTPFRLPEQIGQRGM